MNDRGMHSLGTIASSCSMSDSRGMTPHTFVFHAPPSSSFILQLAATAPGQFVLLSFFHAAQNEFQVTIL